MTDLTLTGVGNLEISDKELKQALLDIIQHEEELEKVYKKDPIFKGTDPIPHWRLTDVPVQWKHVNKLINTKIVKRFGKKYYVLKDRESVKQWLDVQEESDKGSAKKKGSPNRTKRKYVTKPFGKLPPDIFDVIVGFDDIKEFFHMVLNSDEPVHVVLEGAPGTAKSVFLMELERLGAAFITAGTATKVGIRDMIFEELPRLLLIDEIEKIDSVGDLSSLLTWMEDGRIVVTKHGMREERRGTGWVFAACNSTKKLPKELLDRFKHFFIKPYTKEEFHTVVVNYLTKRKKVKKRLAEYIATKTMEYSVSVREAIRISRLAKKKEDVDKLVALTIKYAK